MIPKAETFILKTVTKDKYGTITDTVSTTYYGIIERDSQFRSTQGETTFLGKGIIFTDEVTVSDKVGNEVVVDGDTFTIVKGADIKDFDGVYHHSELIYG
jgi:hypothetical protein